MQFYTQYAFWCGMVMSEKLAGFKLGTLALAAARLFASSGKNPTPGSGKLQRANEIRLNATSAGRVFEGIGAVSAGASTRLLVDYPEPQRRQVLDFLFTPMFGASFQHLKVEVGGGENSTCGSEPSHAITRGEIQNPKARGYEFWLMSEARKRNPKIILDCLPWAYPAWVKDRFSRDAAEWIAAFLLVARRDFGLELDWVAGAQNEMGTDLNWLCQELRPALDKLGFQHVRLQAPDDSNGFWQVFDEFATHPEAARLVGAVGYHYLDGREPWNIDQLRGHPATDAAKFSGKPLWASEEWSQSGGQWGDRGALYLARLMNKVYIRDRVTKFEIWCPVDGIYDQIVWNDTGVMQADTPWCGSYTVWPAVWAVAHTTQFAQPGWVYMDDACAQIDADTWRGSHVALRHPDTGDWSLVICTGDARRVRLTIGEGLRSGIVYVFKSTASEQFVHQAALNVDSGTVDLDLELDALYTITTTTGQQKGSFGEPPQRKPFPLPYAENFDGYRPGDTPRYFSDQKGTFEVVEKQEGGLCLAQIVPEQGILWHGNSPNKPHTLFGDSQWRDYAVEADMRITGGDVEIGGRYTHRDKLGYRFILAHDGRWQLNWQGVSLANGQLSDFANDSWHHMRLEMTGDSVAGIIDGQRLATATCPSTAPGMAVLASTYDRNLFDNIRVEKPATALTS